jgi:hypothetical protein
MLNELNKRLQQKMADEVDVASDMMEAQISRAVAKAAGLEIPKNTTGKCLSCLEKVEDGRRWCDADCREEYERRKN